MDKGYHKLLIWQKGKEFTKLIYVKSETFPKAEIYGLQSQLRRAAIFYLLNIVEGNRRDTQKEFLRFLNIAESSLVEVEACLEIACELNFLNLEDFDIIEDKRKELAIMTRAFVNGLIKKSKQL